MSDGAAFAIDVRRFCEKTKLRADTVVRKVLFDISASVVAMSPVDTGRFRANWQYGMDQLPAGTLDVTDKNGGDGRTTAGRMASMIGPGAVGHVHYIVNNLPYSIRLEYGWSKQAPEGMVRVTLVRFADFFNKAVDEVASS